MIYVQMARQQLTWSIQSQAGNARWHGPSHWIHHQVTDIRVPVHVHHTLDRALFVAKGHLIALLVGVPDPIAIRYRPRTVKTGAR